jgi:GNAT superfamily N-acetyltransferase
MGCDAPSIGSSSCTRTPSLSVSQVSIRRRVVIRPLWSPLRTLPGMPSASTIPTSRVRPAAPGDVPVILRLVRELAEYEKALDAVDASQEQLREALFPADRAPATFAHVAEVGGEVVGCAIWFLSFSTWTGTHGIWLEDLYVTPAQRGSGLGEELLRTLAAICVERGYSRLEWWVLDWNAPSIGFYQSIGAVAQAEWTRFRLDGGALDTMAAPPE